MDKETLSWWRSQVVRQQVATLFIVGSTPTAASKLSRGECWFSGRFIPSPDANSILAAATTAG